MKYYNTKIKLLSSLIMACISMMGISQTTPVQKFHDTKGNIEVTQAGQLQYTMTIDTPPGVQKTAPNISLVYVSGASNGLAGYGWNISGITAISRVGKNLEKDGISKGVQLDYSDYYSFGGQRLILKSGEYGKDGAEYVTEKYSNVKIKSIGTLSGQAWQGPEYWEVTSPDGSQAWYGAIASGNSTARSPIDYNIVKSKDVNGNYISYNYTSEGNVSVISSIEWGGNETQNTPHFNKIEFVFTARPKSEMAYVKGIEFSQSKLLESIVVTASGKQYKKYNVSYKKDVQQTSYRYLNKIVVLNSNNEEANPVVFTYEPSGLSDSIPAQLGTALKPNPDNDVVGDFDGDGNLDLLRYHSTVSSKIPQPGIYLYKDFYSMAYDTWTPIFVGNSLQGLKDATAINFKKDHLIHNRQGFVIKKSFYNPSTAKADLELSFYSITENNQLNLDFKKWINNTDYDWTGSISTVGKLNVIDLNGDGLHELILPVSRLTCPPVNDSDPNGRPPGCRDTKTYYLIDPDQSLQDGQWFYSIILDYELLNTIRNVFDTHKIGDFNGDGVTDLLKINDNKKPYLLTFFKNDQGQYEADTAPFFNPGIIETIDGLWEKAVVGDFNGDGLSDIMIPQANNSTFWNKYTSTGKGFKKESVEFRKPDERAVYVNGPNFSIYNPRNFVAYDINNDGKTELIALKSVRYYSASPTNNNNTAKYTTTSEIQTAFYSITGGYGTMENIYSNGAYLQADQYDLYLNSSDISSETAPNFRDLMGLSGDQWTGGMLRKVVMGSAVGFGSDVGDLQRIVSHPYYDIAKEGRIKSIFQGGIITDITYKKLDKKENPGLYDKVTTPNFPYVEINQSVGMYVVSGMAQTITADNKLKQDFLYRGLTANILGRGMVGFRKTARSSWYADGYENTKIWSAVETDPTNDGVPIKEWSIRTNDGTKVFPTDLSENNTNLLSFKSTTYKIDKLINGQVVTNIPDADKAKVVTAIVPTTTRTKDFLTGVVSENSIIYGEYYLPSASTTSINGNFGRSAKKIVYTHNPSGQGKDYYIGRITSNINEENAYSDTQKITESYTYENNRIKTITKIAGNDTNRAVTDEFTYDGFGNVIQKVTNTAYDTSKQTEKNEFDAKGRFVVKKTDNLGLEALFTYNDWGQVLSQKDTFDNTLTHTYDNWGKLISSTSNLEGTTTYAYERDSNSNVTVTRNEPDGNISKVFTNKFGKEYKTSVKAFGQGQFISKEMLYDVLGRKIKESEPYFEGQTASQWNMITYDDTTYPQSKVMATAFNGKKTETTLSGLTTTVKELSGYGRTTSKTADALGNIISSTDKGGTIQFSYNAAGKQIQAKYAENSVTTKYDVWGRKTEFNDPSNGLYKYEYNGLGQTSKVISPKGFKEYTYNSLGQLVAQKEYSTIDSGQTTNKTITFTYNSKGQLIEKSGLIKGQPFGIVLTYDPKGRLLSSTENSNGKTYIQKGIIYDDKDRILSYEKELRSSGIITKVSVENIYSSWSGELYQMKDKTSGKILWELQQTNAKGQMLQGKLGAANINNTYDANGFLTGVNHYSQVSPDILRISYSFDAVRNELNFRKTTGDIKIEEYFNYDDNNRLINWTNPLTGIKPLANRNVYDIKGRIKENDQVGTMKYENSAKIYQPTGMILNADGVQNYNNDLIQSIVYNENNDPTLISGEKSRVFLEYGLGNMRQRVNIEKFKNGTSSESKSGKNEIWDPDASQWKTAFTKYYNEDGSFEVNVDQNTGLQKHILYIGGSPYESNIVYLRDFGQANGSYKFLHKDYIGSVLAISDEAGNKLEQRHYDAWGNFTHLKLGNDAAITDKSLIAGASLLIDRGYTSHEHFMEVGIIHMNGRLYDPLLRRFLNADENIQDPTNTQNYNKYGYVMNNPMMYNDPSGEYLQWIIGALVGGYLNGVAANNGNWNPVKWDWQRTWGAVVGGAIGGAAISGTLGNIASNTGAIKNFLPGLVSGGLNSAFNGGNFLGGAIGGLSYNTNVFTNRVTSTDGINAGYKYIISPDYNDDTGLNHAVNDKDSWLDNEKDPPYRKLSASEARKRWQARQGGIVDVDVSTIDWSNVDLSEPGNKPGTYRALFDSKHYTNSNQAMIQGTVTFEPVKGKPGYYQIAYDGETRCRCERFDFDIKNNEWTKGRGFVRNIGAIGGTVFNGLSFPAGPRGMLMVNIPRFVGGAPFTIRYNGTFKIGK